MLISEAFAQAGADLIDVSAGQTWEGQQPVYGRMFQTPFSDRIRNEARLATMAVGQGTREQADEFSMQSHQKAAAAIAAGILAVPSAAG